MCATYRYCDLPIEPPEWLPTDPPEGSWPTRGEIEFRNVSMRYRPQVCCCLRCFKDACGILLCTAYTLVYTYRVTSWAL
eukprot:COSAG05_NODE_964_length_6408_cov_2.492154_6_plen_79_part_00